MKVHIGRYPKNPEKPRKISVRIDHYDIWGMDHTLALIIVPMLKLLKEKKHGVPDVDDADVPEELRSKPEHLDSIGLEAFEAKEAKWNYIMDAMIYSMTESMNDYEGEKVAWERVGEMDFESMKESKKDGLTELKWKVEPIFHREIADAYFEKVRFGHCMFGKYFSALWD